MFENNMEPQNAYEENIESQILKGPFLCHTQESSHSTLLFPPHWHYYIEVLYILSGSAKIFIKSTYYEVKAGDMVFINTREVHSGLTEADPVKYFVLRFHPDILVTSAHTVFELKYIIPFTMSKVPTQNLFLSEEIKPTQIPMLIHDIFDEYSREEYGFELAIQTDIGRIFLWILRSLRAKNGQRDLNVPLPQESDLHMLEKIFNYLDLNYQYDITVELMAKMCNMSYSYFSRRFKAIMGKTFIEYLSYVRITEAEELLLATDTTVTEIALQTGFSDTNYFIKQFKRYKGISPKQFRNKVVNSQI